jgi:MFS family permease/quinol monooxygenase YgiN
MAPQLAMPDPPRPASALSPLQNSVFRALWLAQLVTNIGTWVEDVGEGWQMTSMTTSPLLIALVETSSTLALFVLALPGGALADIIDRRRLLLVSQSIMIVASGLLAVTAGFGLMTPGLLLGLIFLLGLGTSLGVAAWQSLLPDLVPRHDLPGAIALNSISFNIGRVVGPAIGGLLVALGGPSFAFALNCGTFFAVVVVLLRWRKPPVRTARSAERVFAAMRTGLRYSRHSPAMRAVLVRTATFMVGGSALFALIPLLARRELGLDALGYGALLASLGGGAVTGAVVLSRLQGTLSADRLAVTAALFFALGFVVLGLTASFPVACAALFGMGTVWLVVVTRHAVAAQLAAPAWVRGRALSVFWLSLQGSLALGSVIWGTVASVWGIPPALLAAAATIAFGTLSAVRFRLQLAEGLDLEPARHWAEPIVLEEPPAGAPTLVMVEYEVAPQHAESFAEAMEPIRRQRLRDGAVRWELARDTARPNRFVESFLVETWAEHVRQHDRVTKEDQAAEARGRKLLVEGTAPTTTHLTLETAPREGRRRRTGGRNRDR